MAGADQREGVDWVAGHPPLAQTARNRYTNILNFERWLLFEKFVAKHLRRTTASSLFADQKVDPRVGINLVSKHFFLLATSQWQCWQCSLILNKLK